MLSCRYISGFRPRGDYSPARCRRRLHFPNESQNRYYSSHCTLSSRFQNSHKWCPGPPLPQRSARGARNTSPNRESSSGYLFAISVELLAPDTAVLPRNAVVRPIVIICGPLGSIFEIERGHPDPNSGDAGERLPTFNHFLDSLGVTAQTADCRYGERLAGLDQDRIALRLVEPPTRQT